MDFKAETEIHAGDTVSIGSLLGTDISEYRGVTPVSAANPYTIGICQRDCDAGDIPNIWLSVVIPALEAACYLYDSLDDLNAVAQKFAATGCSTAHINRAVQTARQRIGAILKAGRAEHRRNVRLVKMLK